MSAADTKTSRLVPSRNVIRRVIFIVYPYAVALVTSPLVGNETLNVARSPTAPATGLIELTSTKAVKAGLVGDVAVPLGLITTVAKDPRSGFNKVLIPPIP